MLLIKLFISAVIADDAGKLVKFAPLIAGKVDGNLASGIVPDVKLLAFKLLKSIVCQVAALPEPPLDNT